MTVAVIAVVLTRAAVPEEAEADWKPAFERVYRPAPGEAVKRVPPPWIPERLSFCRAHNHVDGNQGPAYMILHATPDGGVRAWGHAFGGDGKLPLRHVLSFPLQMKPYEFDGPAELLAIDLPGDWVLRPEATRAEQLAAMTGIIRGATGRLVRFEQRQLEREVIVATGKFAFNRLPDVRHDSVYLYVDRIDPARGGAKTGDLGEFFTTLGMYAHHAVVDDTEVPKPKQFEWVAQNSAYLDSLPAGTARRTRLLALLDNLSKQTGLKFEVGRRKIPVWMVEEGPAAG